ncbi:MAG TPA: NDMA-dependent alcohol dehydrogenase [Trebonia sp.]|jgi:S-(hydroxymethyl)glutathione dehydrogenase/alcohol dehydrogenase|nr:NDMA-dependent alcohol dehydrogenase [Trebonia sp.]
MKVKAAVLHEPGAKYQVEDVELDPPKEGEVLVKFAATGMCHSDEHLVTGDMVLPAEITAMMGWQQFPIIAGHEGAGIVEEVGPGVTALQPGDHVVTSFVPSCGSCPSCASGHQNLCDLGATLLSGRAADGTFRHHTASGDDIATMCWLGTFAEYGVLNTASLVKVPEHIPMEKAALVACGVTTGFGSAVYAADVQPGETVVVIGAGGVGMNAIQGAAIAGARQIVAVDPVEFKREKALAFGATHTAASIEEAAPLVGQLTWGRNANKVILTVGVAQGSMIAPMLAMTTKGGRAVVTAVANILATDAQLNLFDLAMSQKQLVGTLFGSANPRFDIPRLLAMYEAGKLKLDELITRTYSLEQINEGYQDMRDGKNIRGVIVY